jgi:hypothetical protein
MRRIGQSIFHLFSLLCASLNKDSLSSTLIYSLQDKAQTTNPKNYKMGIDSKVDEEDRFELFLLGDGEKKVTEATDTRKLDNGRFLIKEISLLISANRHRQQRHLHLQQGGPHSCQHAPRSIIEESPHPFCWI